MAGSIRTYELPVLPVKNAVVFPHIVIPYATDHPRSIAAIDHALGREDKTLAVFAQRNLAGDSPGLQDLYTIGTSGIVRLFARSDTAMQVFLQGVERVEIAELVSRKEFLMARIRSIPMHRQRDVAAEAMEREVLDLTKKYFSLAHPNLDIKIPQMIPSGEDLNQTIYPLVQILGLSVERSQALLEASSFTEIVQHLGEYLNHEIQILELRKKISDKTQSKISKNQREYILREQLDAIQKELGESNPAESEFIQLQQKFEATALPENIHDEVKKELNRLHQIPTISPEYQIARAHMELVLDLPWDSVTETIWTCGMPVTSWTRNTMD